MICTKCKRTDLSEKDFYRRSSGKLHSECKSCHKARNETYRNKNKERLKLKRKEEYRLNVEINKANSRRWHKDNPERYRNGQLLRKYGITLEEFNQILIFQENQCAICHSVLDIACLDHCHKTNVVRGVLCTKCNLGMGQFDDDPDLLASASAYLLRFIAGPGG